jgi:DNA helicase II / ATP-dependent DNA helicase PcrA
MLEVSEEVFHNLNDKQKEAVLYNDGPLLIMAGAGSGKTRVLTHKIAYLHKQYKVPVSNILAVTFTNKAANEMKERVQDLLKIEKDSFFDNWIMTFHSLSFKILKMYADKLGYDKSFIIYDSSDQLSMIKQIMNELNIDSENHKPKAIQYQISKAKNDFIFPDKFKETANVEFLNATSEVYFEYQKKLKLNNAMDFDDLLVNTVLLLKENKSILEYFQKKFEFILIDEYQDINMPQYHITYMLSALHRRIFVVGDTDQNIYSWRGANLQNILNFEKDFPDAKVILLEQNYRSSANILKLANSLIINNKLRKDKSLWTEQKEGEIASFFLGQNDYDEAENAIKKVRDLINKGVPLSEIAFLYRTNAMSRVIETILMQYNIKYKIYGGLRFYDRKEIKDILAYLKLILNSKDDVSFQRIVNVPSRKIGKLTLTKVQEQSAQDSTSFFETISNMEDTRGFLSLDNFKNLVLDIQKEYSKNNISVSELIELVISKTGYREMLINDKTIESKGKLENIEELKKSASEQNYSLDEFISMSTLLSSQDEYTDDEQSLSLMTMHSAKGLEYDCVFVFGLEEGIFPHIQSMGKESEIEEERRLCYVAITRARKKVFLSASCNRGSLGSTVPKELSRFFYELPPELIDAKLSDKLSSFNYLAEELSKKPEYNIKKMSTESIASKKKDYEKDSNKFVPSTYQVGDVVRSQTFGDGVVKQIFGTGKEMSLQVQFRQEMKLIMPKYAKLEKV